MNLRGWIVLPLLSTPVFAGAMLAYQFALHKAWVPFDGPLVFLHYRLPHAHGWWLRFAAIDAVWNIAFITAIAYAPAIARVLGRRFLATVLGAQALSLAVLVCTPIPLDSDQYAYAYYGSLALGRWEMLPCCSRLKQPAQTQERLRCVRSPRWPPSRAHFCFGRRSAADRGSLRDCRFCGQPARFARRGNRGAQ